MRKHLAETEAFINDLLIIGEVYGFITKVEHKLTKSGWISADLTWRMTAHGDPVFIFEVESAKNPNMVQNAMKIFGSRVTDVKKLWFFFHILYRGDAGSYADSLSMLKEYFMYHLFENASQEKIKTDLIIHIHKCVLSILSEIKFEAVWERFRKIGNIIKDVSMQSMFKEQIVDSLNLPKEIIFMIREGQLTVDQGKKLDEIKKYHARISRKTLS